LKDKRKLRKWWHETRDSACKTAVNWVTKYQKNVLEKSTWKTGNKFGKLLIHASSNMAYCKITHKKAWIKGTICNSCSLRPHILSTRKTNINADCLENQLRARELCEVKT
jgi:hypothetical protein